MIASTSISTINPGVASCAPTAVEYRRGVAERLPVGPGERAGVGHVDQVGAGADHVVEARADRSQRGIDPLQHEPGLGFGVTWSVNPTRGLDRGSPGDVDERPDPLGPDVAADLLEPAAVPVLSALPTLRRFDHDSSAVSGVPNSVYDNR